VPRRRSRSPLTSANSVNVGRLLPQSVYYFHALAQLAARGAAAGGVVMATPSGNFGNLTAGLFAKRAGLGIDRFIAATNVNDVVPAYLATGEFTPRPSVRTLANAMDVGHPSNFERMRWLYGDDAAAMRRDISGTCYADDDVRRAIRDVHARSGYLLDPHSAIGYLGLKAYLAHGDRRGTTDGPACGVFLATAHPAKFGEVVEPIIGRAIEKPPALAAAMARPRHIVRIDATFEALRHVLES